VIASQAGGAAELIADGHNALAHPPGDAEALARAIERLARDRALRQRLGVAGKAAAELHYTRERLANQLCALYHRIAQPVSLPSKDLVGVELESR